jgi:hypothetical protein
VLQGRLAPDSIALRAITSRYSNKYSAPKIAPKSATCIVSKMSTVTEIEHAIEKLTPAEQHELVHRLEERLADEETPEMLSALDVGIRSLQQNGARVVTRHELGQKIRKWSGV